MSKRKKVDDLHDLISRLNMQSMSSPWYALPIGNVMQEASEAIVQLLSQLPKGMEDCTIEIKECPVGHIQLMAKNWTDSGCPWCRIYDLKEQLDDSYHAESVTAKQEKQDLPTVCGYAAPSVTVEEHVWDQVRTEGPKGAKGQYVADEIEDMSNNRLLFHISEAIEKRLKEAQKP